MWTVKWGMQFWLDEFLVLIWRGGESWGSWCLVGVSSRGGQQSGWKPCSPWWRGGWWGQRGGQRRQIWVGEEGGDVEEFGQIGGERLWRALNVNRRILKSMQSLTGGQWSCCLTGVMWWIEGVLVMIRAAEFLNSWSLWRYLWGRPKRRELQ